jgi:hypothetical protein
MKRSHILLLFCCIIILGCESKPDLVKAFREKNIGHIMVNVTFPFDLEAGTQEDMKGIPNAYILKAKLDKIFTTDYFKEALEGKEIREENNIIIESRSFNEKGELESESTISFHFKNEGGQKKLYAISLAG